MIDVSISDINITKSYQVKKKDKNKSHLIYFHYQKKGYFTINYS